MFEVNTLELVDRKCSHSLKLEGVTIIDFCTVHLFVVVFGFFVRFPVPEDHLRFVSFFVKVFSVVIIVMC